ncbi:hypothetical protein CN359_30520 [Bacillus thuringiensis]|nr:hypothetical protein CN359_30520 [Bacillus thuringiensis]
MRPLGTDGEGVVQVRACAPDLTTGLVSGVSVDIAELADPSLADPTVAHDGRVPVGAQNVPVLDGHARVPLLGREASLGHAGDLVARPHGLGQRVGQAGIVEAIHHQFTAVDVDVDCLRGGGGEVPNRQALGLRVAHAWVLGNVPRDLRGVRLKAHVSPPAGSPRWRPRRRTGPPGTG